MHTVTSDLLARWVAETREGTTRDLRDRAQWAARTADRVVSAAEAGRWLRDLSNLGSIEIDWDAGRWSACPLVVTRLPGPDAYAVLAGPRTARQDAAIERSALGVHRVPQPATGPDHLDRPTVVLLQYDQPGDLPAAAVAMGAEWVPCAALQLGDLLQSPEPGLQAAQPRYADPSLERFDGSALRWRPEPPAAEHSVGAYRVDVEGRKRYLFGSSGQWRRCDLPTAVFSELARTGRSAFQWRPEGGAGRNKFGTVFTDWGAPLPTLHQRALTLCTGFVPRFWAGAETAAYRNIPRVLADRVAATLHQQITPA